MNKLSPKACGMAMGVLWGVSMVFMGITAMVCSWAQPFVDVIGTMYVGYTATIIGCLAGAVWGFFDGLIGGAIFGWLYNKFV